MRIQCQSNEMSAALSIVTRALSARAVSPIYEGVLLTTCAEGLRLTCTDLAIGIETYVDAQVQQEGGIVLPGRLFTEIVRKLPEGMIDLSVDDRNVATIRCAGSRMNLAGMDTDEFPALAEVEDGCELKVSQKALRDMVQRTSFAIATDETRIILTGCLLETEGNELYVVALDGFQLALRKLAFEEELPKLSAVVPGKALGRVGENTGGQRESRLFAVWKIAPAGRYRPHACCGAPAGGRVHPLPSDFAAGMANARAREQGGTGGGRGPCGADGARE